MKRLTGTVVAGALLVAVGGWQGSAEAAGFATQTFGGEHGSVVETNPTALYYNPGALGFSSGSAIGLYGALALHGMSWSHNHQPDEVSGTASSDQTDTGKAQLLNVFGGASLAGTTHLTKNLVIAGGFFAPFFGISHWAKDNDFNGAKSFPQAYDGIQRWFGIDGKIEVLYFSLGAAYKLGPLSIGATGNFISSTFANYQARNTASHGLPDMYNEGRSYFDVQGYNGSFGIGAMLQAIPDQLFIGASYQAQPGLGEQKLDGDLYITPPTGVQTHTLVTLHQSLPDIIRVGARFHPKSIPWEFRLYGDYTRWSQLTHQCLTSKGSPCDIDASTGAAIMGKTEGIVWGNVLRNWKDTVGVRLGASYYVSPTIETFAGAGYETAAVPDATMAPDVPDANNVTLAIGGRFALTDTLFFAASYTHIQYMDRDVTGSQLLSQGGYNVEYPTVEGSGNGHYTQWAGFFSGNLEAIF